MMENYNESTEIKHNPNWSYIHDYPYRRLITGITGLGKTNLLMKLKNYWQPGVEKIYS